MYQKLSVQGSGTLVMIIGPIIIKSFVVFVESEASLKIVSTQIDITLLNRYLVIQEIDHVRYCYEFVENETNISALSTPVDEEPTTLLDKHLVPQYMIQ